MTDTDKQAEERAKENVRFRDVAPAIEFICWIVIVLAPILRWVNGPAVTGDQSVIQSVFMSVAVSSAVGLRFYNWRQNR